jgi:hypothetical protein
MRMPNVFKYTSTYTAYTYICIVQYSTVPAAALHCAVSAVLQSACSVLAVHQQEPPLSVRQLVD